MDHEFTGLAFDGRRGIHWKFFSGKQSAVITYFRFGLHSQCDRIDSILRKDKLKRFLPLTDQMSSAQRLHREDRASCIVCTVDDIQHLLGRPIRDADAGSELELDALMDELADDEVVRVKEVDFAPMTEEEALVQIELLDHDFFGYVDRDTELFSILYRRTNGGYGLLRQKVLGEQEG